MSTLPPVFWLGYILVLGGTLLAARRQYKEEKARGFFWPVSASIAVSLFGAATVLLVLPGNQSDYWRSHPGMGVIDAWFMVMLVLALSALSSALITLIALGNAVLLRRKEGIWQSVLYAILATGTTFMTLVWAIQGMPME